jgi:acetyl-CoA acetyltransferase
MREIKDPFKRSVAIVGVSESQCGRGVGLSAVQHQALAAKKALDDAGLSHSDVDALLTTEIVGLPSLKVAEYLGIKTRFTDTTITGGSSFVLFVERAALAIAAGLCDVALITYGSSLWSDRRRLLDESGLDPNMSAARYEVPYGDLTPISSYALAATRHMYEYGTTSEQLAEVAVASRQWAMLNPNALLRELITTADVIESPMISSPFHKLDCCLMTDGGGAVVVTSAERAKNLRKPPVYLLGSGFGATHLNINQMETLTTSGAAISGPKAFERAGVTPKDIDVVQIYDSFTFSVILALEDLGFCKKGEGGQFVQNGRLGPGGPLPTNTSGGGLSYTHPGAFGIFLVIEAVRQLRGECADRQVADAQLALVHGIGGWLSSHSTLILSN